MSYESIKTQVKSKKETRIEFVSSFSEQSNNFKIKLKLKVQEFCADSRLYFLSNIWYVAPNFNWVLSEFYSEPSPTFKMESFVKIVNSWIPLTFFCETLHLRYLPGFWKPLQLTRISFLLLSILYRLWLFFLL